MHILNLYYSATGNTKKVAERIAATSVAEGHTVETVQLKKSTDVQFDVRAYDLIFSGSGVYEWLPGKPVMSAFSAMTKNYREKGLIQQPAQRRRNNRAVTYCTYGGTHTGANEAVPAVKYMGQFFDHLGFEIIGEWYFVGEFHGAFRDFSLRGKLGDISGRPDETDLRHISEMVKGVLKL